METISERIAILVKHFGRGRNTVLANLINSSEGNIRGYIKNGVTPKHDVLERIVRTLGVNAKWLITGEGPMLGKESEASVPKGLDAISIPIVGIDALIGVLGNNHADRPETPETAESISIPDNMLQREAGYYCIRVGGESMWPTLLDPGYLIVRLLDRNEWKKLKDEQVYVIVTLDGRLFVRRIKNQLKERGIISCMSDNPDKSLYPEFSLFTGDLHKILHVEWYFTAKILNVHEPYHTKLERLEDKYDALQIQLDEIKKGLKRAR
jgi:phage repressor protein C with HTH and peptisase S24 domain